MSTNLQKPTLIGSQVTSIVAVTATVRADGSVLVDWQGLDANGVALVRQVAAFAAKDVDILFKCPVSGLLAAAEAAIVQAIASSGNAPPTDLPRPGPMPAFVSALATARGTRKAAAGE